MAAELNSKCWYKKVCQHKECSSCIRYPEMLYMMQNSGLPEAKWHPIDLYAGTRNDETMFKRLAEIKSRITDFVDSGENLYIGSKYTGNGKTSWAIKLLFRYFDQVWAGNGFRIRGMFVHVPTLLLKLKDFKNPLPVEYRKNIENCDLIVWDDIASAELSNYDYSQLLMMIDSRMLSEKSNIFTGNIIKEQNLMDVVGERLASRIFNTSQIVIFDGKDQR